MLFDKFRHFITRLTQSPTRTVADYRADTESVPAVEFDPMWHGDHWQNLLSSPMDARRYVIEDWSVSIAPDWTEANAPAH
ncbi:hypothetical protein [Paraburkholderia lacunae]|uniref:Uncharacterized protein n=1 Tax=Paraburkholderia lacunae TaxID=2211104 RepID=A0A370NFN7_9BURK|nr:hypothetical protein [Paraburkholderia lacunae]RDK04403.1 hypothetical protein DLM46_00485 [Paraburkholderia lacunae]